MILTAERLLHYQRCNRRAFLDVYGEKGKLDPPSNFLLKLQQDRIAHQKNVLAEQTYFQPNYPKKDWQAGFEATLALMRQGVERIHKGVLLCEGTGVQHLRERDVDAVAASRRVGEGEERGRGTRERENFPVVGAGLPRPYQSPVTSTLLSFPDLLVKQPGESVFGDWFYVPFQIELGKRPKQEYKISAAFHALVLARVQGVLPTAAWLILRDRKEYPVNLEHWVIQMQKILEECSQALGESLPPEVFISRQKCNLCHWYTNCYEVAKSQQHLSLLPGVSPSRYRYLQELNLTTVESLANAKSAELEPIFDVEIADQLVRQAQSTLENRVILNSNLAFYLPTSSVELYFDIESQPEIDLAYLLGVLVVNRETKTENYYAFLAKESSEERVIWQQFLDLVWTYPEAPIFHFCDYEVQMVGQLAGRYKTPNYLWQPLFNRLVDVHQQLTQTATLPIENYSLKAIARWLGFEWRDPSANGSQAICWYDEWLKKGDRAFLDMIVRYNEDDCLATHRVKDWLADIVKSIDKIDLIE